MHHPFTSPKDGHEDLLETDPGRVLAKAYDIVAERLGARRRLGADPPRGGAEQGVPRAQDRRTRRQRAKFGFLLDALQYGAPPHGGIAFGLDRIVDADDRRRVDPRRDRVPEDAARAVPAHRTRRARSTRSSCASCTSGCATRRRRRGLSAIGRGSAAIGRGPAAGAPFKIPESVLVVIHTPRARRAADRACRRARVSGRASPARRTRSANRSSRPASARSPRRPAS